MPKISVTVHENECLPKLCWLLILHTDSGNTEIKVGNKVELLEEAIIEGCWDGDFGVDGLENKNLFGSAVKWSEESLTVLGSISLTDRICYAKVDDRVIVSNSLFAVMGSVGAEFDEGGNYYKVSYAPLAGIDHYPSEIPVKHESIKVVHQIYHQNIAISACGEIESSCKTSACKYDCFTSYEESLSNCLEKLVRNITSENRVHRVVPYATLSSGYDSTAVAALAKDVGVTRALLCSKPKPRIFDVFGERYSDDGSEAGLALGLNVNYVNGRDFIIDEDELLYIAPSASTPETSFFPMAKFIENTEYLGAVFTGYHGDKLWDKNLSSKYFNDQLIRGDMSGINISEARLKSGFFNVAIPFLFARSAVSIGMIGRSEEMSEWSIGGNYDRPIARRLAEDRGVSRDSFGVRKRAIIDRYPEPRNDVLADEFRSFMKNRYGYTGFSFIRSKWRYLISLTIGRRIKFLTIKSRSRDDLSYWLWFWAATRCIRSYKKMIQIGSRKN